MNIVEQAKEFATRAHEGQKRKFTGEDYIEHPKHLVSLLISAGVTNENILAAGWLHDVVEDTEVGFKELEKTFPNEVLSLVQEVTNSKSEISKVGKDEYIKNLAMNLSYNASCVKMADRIVNLLDCHQSGTPLSFITKILNNTEYLIEGFKVRNERVHMYNYLYDMLMSVHESLLLKSLIMIEEVE